VSNDLFVQTSGRRRYLTTSSIVARREYHHRILTRLSGNRPQAACYALAATIFSLGLLRDYLFHHAMLDQPTHPLLLGRHVRLLALMLLAAGNTLVITSTWALGITGTFLGDYFGFLNEGGMVTGFPFNVTDAPMYWGSTMNFVGGALLLGKPAGLLLALEVWAVYKVALRFEDSFTREIYARRDRERALGKKVR